MIYNAIKGYPINATWFFFDHVHRAKAHHFESLYIEGIISIIYEHFKVSLLIEDQQLLSLGLEKLKKNGGLSVYHKCYYSNTTIGSYIKLSKVEKTFLNNLALVLNLASVDDIEVMWVDHIMKWSLDLVHWRRFLKNTLLGSWKVKDWR